MQTAAVLVGTVLVFWFAFFLAARHFERRKQREGSWDASGPKHPTLPPPNPDLTAVGVRGPTIERE